MPLSVSELKKYYKDGFVIPDYRFSEETLEAIKSDYDKLLRVNPEFKDYCPYLLQYDLGFLNYARDPNILDMVEQVLGFDLILWNSSLFAKPAKNGKKTPCAKSQQGITDSNLSFRMLRFNKFTQVVI